MLKLREQWAIYHLDNDYSTDHAILVAGMAGSRKRLSDNSALMRSHAKVCYICPEINQLSNHREPKYAFRPYWVSTATVYPQTKNDLPMHKQNTTNAVDTHHDSLIIHTFRRPCEPVHYNQKGIIVESPECSNCEQRAMPNATVTVSLRNEALH